MKKYLLSLAVIIAFPVTLSLYQPKSFWSAKKINKLQESTVVVLTALNEELTALGTGVIIGKRGLVLTAAHVVRKESSLDRTVTTHNGKCYEYEIIGMNKRTDLALVQIINSAQKFPYVKLQKSNKLTVGTEILIIGHPNGELYFTSFGRITRFVFSLGYFCVIGETNAYINSGNSGGPVFNRRGEVVGIVSSMRVNALRKPIGIGVFIPIKQIHHFLDRLELNTKI